MLDVDDGHAPVHHPLQQQSQGGFMVPLQHRLWCKGKGKAGVIGVGGPTTVGDAGQLAGAAHGRGAPTCTRQLSVGIPVGVPAGVPVGVTVGVAGWLMLGVTVVVIGIQAA